MSTSLAVENVMYISTYVSGLDILESILDSNPKQANSPYYHSTSHEKVYVEDDIVQCVACNKWITARDWNVVWIPKRRSNYYCCSSRCMRYIAECIGK